MTNEVYNNTVTKATIQGIYATRLQGSLVKFARAVTGESVSVKLETSVVAMHGMPPAWSTDTGMTVCHKSGNIASASSVMRIKGLVIHELAHMLYTPRSRTQFIKWVHERHYAKTFNILEDNRIENFMVANMSGVKPWLVHTVTKEFLTDTNASELAGLLPLVWGRKYLPLNIRTAAVKTWPHGNASQVTDIIDKYVVLNFNDKSHIDTAKQLIAELHTILNQHPQSAQTQSPMHDNNSAAAPSSSGIDASANKRETDKAIKRVENAMDAESDTDDGDVDDTSDDISNDTSADTHATNSPSSQGSGSALQQALAEANASAEEAVLDDVKSMVDNIRDASADVAHSIDVMDTPAEKRVIKPLSRHKIQAEAVSSESIASSKLFARELNEVRALFDPAWVRKTDVGRLNARNYILDRNIDEAFDLWDQGNDDVTDIECVILLDNSGSMRDMIKPAYEAMWSIKRALDSVNASTTVIQFGTWGDILYTADQKASTKMLTARWEGGGNTNPLNSLIKANEILDNSSRAIKMMIVITDGDWYNEAACNQVIATMRTRDILTGLVYILDENYMEKVERVYGAEYAAGMRRINAHYCEVATQVSDPKDIVKFAKDMAKLSQARVLAN